MWKATIRGLFARKVRLALTALAILLGVSFVSATYVLTDTVKRSFDAVFAQTLCRGRPPGAGASALGDVLQRRGGSPTPSIDEVRAVPGVRTARGVRQTRSRSSSTPTARPSAGAGRRPSGSRGSTTGRSASPRGRAPDGPGRGGDGRRDRREARLLGRRPRAGAAQRGGEAVPRSSACSASVTATTSAR